MIKFFTTLFLICLGFFSIAQPPKKPVAKPIASAVRFKPPKLTCSLGNYKDSAYITASEGVQLIATLHLVCYLNHRTCSTRRTDGETHQAANPTATTRWL